MKQRLTLLVFIFGCALFFVTPASANAGHCDGTTSGDDIVCAVSPTSPDTNIEANAGSDRIRIASGVTAGTVAGDGRTGGPLGTSSSPDAIRNEGTVASIIGDYVSGSGSNDLIINVGVVTGSILGDYATAAAGFDHILTAGIVQGDIYGDYAVGHNNLPTGQGRDDTIEIAGRVDGVVYGEGGNDRVLLHNGASGGSDNRLILDGGSNGITAGEGDRLIFSMTVADSATRQSLTQTLILASPAAGSIVINGQTFEWRHFEFIETNIHNWGDCDGTPNADTLTCDDIPVNSDDIIDGGGGADQITVAAWVSAGSITADGRPGEFNSGGLSFADGAADQVLNDGSVAYIVGDYGWGRSAADEITNNGSGGQISGDIITDGNGANDSIINNGFATTIDGDRLNILAFGGSGGSDTITNAEGAVAETLRGENVEFDARFWGMFTAGSDTITNLGTVNVSIWGDWMYTGSSLNARIFGGNDTITNGGLVEQNIIGDGLLNDLNGTGGNDTITNSGVVQGFIAGDYLSSGSSVAGRDVILNLGTVNEDIYGDYIFDTSYPTGAGAADQIGSAGVVEGSIFAEGGDDRVVMYDGATGGSDNLLPMLGGDGVDTLAFAFTDLSPEQIAELETADPANGSFTHNGQTFTWIAFEVIEVPTLVGDCDGTPDDDMILCAASPVTPDANIEADLGSDQITIAAGTAAGAVLGDGVPGLADLLPIGDGSLGGNDTIINNGVVQSINSQGGDDTIIVNGLVNASILTEGGNDTVTLQMGFSGGADNFLPIDGGVGSDLLRFELTPNAILSGITGTPASGSATVNGIVVQWSNFERIDGLNTTLQLLAPTGIIADAYGSPLYRWADSGDDTFEFYMDGSAADVYPAYYVAGLEDDLYCNGVECVFDPTTLSETARLPYNGTYYVYLRGTRGGVMGPVVGPFYFTLNAAPPSPVTDLAAADTNTRRPTFTWTLPESALGSWYFRLYLIPQSLYDAGIFTPTADLWFMRKDVCAGASGTTCAITWGADLADETAYYLYVQTYSPGGYSVGGPLGNGWAGANFTISVPKPGIPTNVTVDVRQGRPLIAWNDEALATRFYIAMQHLDSGQWVYSRYHDKAGNPALTCDGTRCTLLAEDMILTNGRYVVYINGEGTGGASVGGAWGNGFSDGTHFTLSFGVPALVSNLAASYASGAVSISFTSTPGATWYYVWVGTAGAAQTYYLTWHSSEALNCAAPAQTCSLSLPLALPSGTQLYAAIQSAGPGGVSIGGLVNNGFEVSEMFPVP